MTQNKLRLPDITVALCLCRKEQTEQHITICTYSRHIPALQRHPEKYETKDLTSLAFGSEQNNSQSTWYKRKQTLIRRFDMTLRSKYE